MPPPPVAGTVNGTILPLNTYPYFPPIRQHYYPPNHSHLFYYNHPYGHYDAYYPHAMSQDNTRKRQRRQTAGAYIQNFFGGKNANSKKKSTAQPRPAIVVPPRGIGPVHEPNENDVLAGRGGRINAHKGNVQFRELVAQNKQRYLAKSTKKLEKAHIAAEIVQFIRTLEPSGRFLKEDADGAWWDIGDQKAIKKVGQALREDAPDIRGDVDDPGDEEENNEKPEAETPSDTVEQDATSPLPKTSQGPRPGVTVSGRGAKIVSVPIGSPNEQQQAPTPVNGTYKTLAYQELSPPDHYEQVVPAARGQYVPRGGPRRGILNSSGAGVSGAAAAAMQQGHEANFEAPHPRDDLAFGRPFVHPPHNVDGHRENSLVSGLSNPSMLSGMPSDISALTDPVSSISENYQRTRREQLAYQMRQRENLNQLRQQWAHETNRHLPPANSVGSTDMTATRHLSGSAGIGSSLARSNSFSDMQVSTDMACLSVSTPDHSLVGGGIREGSMLSGLSAGMQASPARVYRKPADSSWGADMQMVQSGPAQTFRPDGQHIPQPYQQQVAYQPAPYQHHQPVQPQPSDSASVASMSMNSTAESLNSIMTDLSDNLIALDLAENRLLDRL